MDNRKTGKNIKCLFCKKEFYASGWQLKRPTIFCSRKCYYKGYIPWNKTFNYLNCLICNKKIRVPPSWPKKGWGKYCSAKCRQKSMEGFVPWNKGLKGFMAGKKHWNWQGGIQSSNTKIRRSAKYRNWVFSVFKRDDFTCQDCSKKEEVSGKLRADHILPFSKFSKYRFDINNGRTLCVDCHEIKTKQDWILDRIKRRTGNAWLTNA